MRVLLVHPEDDLPRKKFLREWDLVVDLGRAPQSTYTRWSAETDCPVICIYDFSRGLEDLRLCGEHLKLGMGCLVDRFGIDWWDVLSLGFVHGLQQSLLFERLSNYIETPSQLYATRPVPLANVFLNNKSPLKILGGASRTMQRRVRRWTHVLRNFDAPQIWQIIQDKCDPRHAIRSSVSRATSKSSMPAILLPSAYVSVSRMAIRLAELLPDQRFLLVLARRNAKLQALPANVSTKSLDAYFGSAHNQDSHLFPAWRLLKRRLVGEHRIFAALDHAGILGGFESDLQRMLRIRDAWANVFETENITGCLSADDTNPYTRIPLLFAKNRGLPTVACHHGALDCYMSLKSLAADSYLAKTEMERDYLTSTCELAREKIAAPVSKAMKSRVPHAREKSLIVFFTEAFDANGWRGEEVYKDLLPKLKSLAQTCGLQLVIKLHPFDSKRAHAKRLRRILGNQATTIQLLAGTPADDLWLKTKFALAVESSTVLECAQRGIPVFLCTWLRDAYSGYSRQYVKFGLGEPLSSPEQLADIPQLLNVQNRNRLNAQEMVNPATLRSLFIPHPAQGVAPQWEEPVTCINGAIA